MEGIYEKLEKILKGSAKKHGLLVKKTTLDSVAKNPKTQLHLYGKKEVQIFKNPKRLTYVAGIMQHKNFVGFYSMAVYAFPKEFSLSPELKKIMKGKSCFNVRTLDVKMMKEIKDIVEKNIKIFKKEGWI